MRGDLQHRIGRRVKDGVSSANVFSAELVKNGCAATGIIPDKLQSRFPLDRINQFVGKSQEYREWLVEYDPGDFPVTGGSVLAGRAFLHFAETGKMRQSEGLPGPGIFFVQYLG